VCRVTSGGRAATAAGTATDAGDDSVALAVRPERQARRAARPAATAPASIAALVPEAVDATGSWPTAAAIAGRAAAPMAAPTCRLVLMTPPTTPCSAAGTPAVAMTMVPKAVPAVPNPTSMTLARTRL
jgi:hypothetical protein